MFAHRSLGNRSATASRHFVKACCRASFLRCGLQITSSIFLKQPFSWRRIVLRPTRPHTAKATEATFAGSNRVRKIEAPQLFVAIELLLKGFAGARNQHYLQLWRPAA